MEEPKADAGRKGIRGRGFLYQRLRSLVLLTALVAVILASGMSRDKSILPDIIGNLFYLVVFCVAGYLIGARRGWLFGYIWLAAPMLIMGVLVVIYPDNTAFHLARGGLSVGLQLILVWLVFRFSLFEDGIEELDRMIAGICGYLILGLLFANLYWFYDMIRPGEFTDSSGAELGGDVGGFVYFSLVTLTTLGYGDISPTTRFPRLLASLEAVGGTLYLAVFISSLIAGRRRSGD